MYTSIIISHCRDKYDSSNGDFGIIRKKSLFEVVHIKLQRLTCRRTGLAFNFFLMLSKEKRRLCEKLKEDIN